MKMETFLFTKVSKGQAQNKKCQAPLHSTLRPRFAKEAPEVLGDVKINMDCRSTNGQKGVCAGSWNVEQLS